MIIMSSFSSVVPQSRVSVLFKLISANSMDTRLWLRGEMARLVDPMLDALFLRLIMSPASVEQQRILTVSELCQLIEGEKEETNRLVRGEMDRLVNSLFLKLTKKLLVNIDWARSRNVGDRSQVANPFHHVESPNTESHQPVLIPKQSSFDPHFHHSHQIGVEEEFNSKILTGVKRELEDGEHEMALETIQVNATLTNQLGTGPSSTDDHHLFYQMNSTLGDGHLSNQPISADHQQNGQVNNDTQQDWEESEIKEVGDDEQMLDEEEEEIVDGSDHEEEVGDDETEIDSDNHEEDEDNQNEESYRLIASPPLDTTSQPNQSPIRRQTARIVKRKVTEKQQPKQMANRDSKDDEEEGEVADQVTSRSVKRLRSSRQTTLSDTEQKQIITHSSEKISNRFSTNPIQPNRHFQCSHCHKSFYHKSVLQTHLRVHTGERPFRCDLCDKRFKQKNKLTRHQLSHQNVKRFRCPRCEKQFNRKDYLDSHLRTHSGERPFTCRHCEKSFSALFARNTHERAIHLHVKPYRCKQCGHTATQRSHVIRHIREVHFGLPESIKEQRALNIVDDRDPGELVEIV